MIRKIIDLATSQVGYVERKTNLTKYGEAYGWNGVYWCVQFIWWLFAQLGLSKLFYGGGKTASCSQLYAYHKKHGQAVSWSQLRVGDIMFMCFDGSGDTDHVGIVIEVKDGYVITVEGNTNSGDGGSQTNGGGVYKRTRKKKYFVAAYRPAYDDAAVYKPVGYSADSFIRDVQRAIGAEVDGIVGAETRSKLPLIKTAENAEHPAVAHVQVRLYALGYNVGEDGADGIYGENTAFAVAKFQSDRGITADGECGGDTFTELFKE